MNRVAVLGAGSWGTALSVHLARAGRHVRLWARDAALVNDMIAASANPRYLPDIPFPSGVTPTASLDAALQDAAFIVVAVPSHGLRAVVRAAARLSDRWQSLRRPRLEVVGSSPAMQSVVS